MPYIIARWNVDQNLCQLRLQSFMNTSNAQLRLDLSRLSPRLSSSPFCKSRSLSIKGAIFLVVGPPGAGKTSLCQSTSSISLGSVRDEVKICADVTSSRGSVVQLLPVILLDEVDKIGQSNLRGDPSTAFLEILDLKQNWSFNNDYIYLSQVLFIYTTNFLDTISSPLFNRCEIVHLAGGFIQ